MAAGHWVPEMIARAGGNDIFGTVGAKSRWITWDQVRAEDPELIVAAPCSYTMAQTWEERWRLTRRPGWKKLSAVKNKRVFIVNGAFFHHAGPRLMDGVELLAPLIHPEIFKTGRRSKQFRRLI